MCDSERSEVGLTQLRRSRAVRKRQITMLLKMLDESPESAMYHQTTSRMADGGFTLRSWVSNNAALQREFHNDRCGTDHGSSSEKVLGYQYYPATDTMCVSRMSPVSTEGTATKRKVLSQLAKVFDPLGLVTPALVSSKIFLRKLWLAKYAWDDPLNEEHCQEWQTISSNVQQLTNFSFQRKTIDSDKEVSLILFSDASQTSYGCAMYAVQQYDDHCNSNLIFSKNKIAPIKSKSVPTLELLAVFLAFKCLFSILESEKFKVSSVTFGIDAQIVLSWILTNKVKAKNVFARNRVKDISEFRVELEKKYGLDAKFRFIPTELNPADLVTRDVNIVEFQKKFQFWIHGPDFLSSTFVWPQRELGCLSPVNGALASNFALQGREDKSTLPTGSAVAADEAADEAEAEVPTAVERPERAAAVRCKERLRHCN
ncbi:uncharacterized protein LOC125178101 [Hyalella azteca]|uniref:Uncharacterized protein LOC125178101 n=1 Tax=Hyalella azteca TaxID=294128 RepID=A0A979FKJ3_HYAAZ|nr:uncharacterized protein LOC125178101 [Hyalella azteca]